MFNVSKTIVPEIWEKPEDLINSPIIQEILQNTSTRCGEVIDIEKPQQEIIDIYTKILSNTPISNKEQRYILAFLDDQKARIIIGKYFQELFIPLGESNNEFIKNYLKKTKGNIDISQLIHDLKKYIESAIVISGDNIKLRGKLESGFDIYTYTNEAQETKLFTLNINNGKGFFYKDFNIENLEVINNDLIFMSYKDGEDEYGDLKYTGTFFELKEDENGEGNPIMYNTYNMEGVINIDNFKGDMYRSYTQYEKVGLIYIEYTDEDNKNIKIRESIPGIHSNIEIMQGIGIIVASDETMEVNLMGFCIKIISEIHLYIEEYIEKGTQVYHIGNIKNTDIGNKDGNISISNVVYTEQGIYIQMLTDNPGNKGLYKLIDDINDEKNIEGVSDLSLALGVDIGKEDDDIDNRLSNFTVENNKKKHPYKKIKEVYLFNELYGSINEAFYKGYPVILGENMVVLDGDTIKFLIKGVSYSSRYYFEKKSFIYLGEPYYYHEGSLYKFRKGVKVDINTKTIKERGGFFSKKRKFSRDYFKMKDLLEEVQTPLN